MNAEGKKDGKSRRITTAQPGETQENRKRKRTARASGCVRKMQRRINDGDARETGVRRLEKGKSGAFLSRTCEAAIKAKRCENAPPQRDYYTL